MAAGRMNEVAPNLPAKSPRIIPQPKKKIEVIKNNNQAGLFPVLDFEISKLFPRK